MGVVKDDPELMDRPSWKQAANADVLITSGGVSVGEADYVKETLLKHGQVDFWKVAMKPGRPLTFGKLDSTYFFGLPGNPVSVMVTFYQFVQPALKKMLGERSTMPIMMKVPCISKVKETSGSGRISTGHTRSKTKPVA